MAFFFFFFNQEGFSSWEFSLFILMLTDGSALGIVFPEIIILQEKEQHFSVGKESVRAFSFNQKCIGIKQL